MEKAFSITIDNSSNPQRRHWRQNMFYANRPLVLLMTCIGLPAYRHHGSKVTTLSVFNRIYGLILCSILCVPIFYSHPSSFDLMRDEFPLHFLVVTHLNFRFFEVNYAIFMANFFNSSLYIELFKCLNNVDNHLDIGTKSVYRNIRRFSWYHAGFVLGLTATTYAVTVYTYTTPVTIGSHILELLLLISNGQASAMIYLIQNLVMRHRLLNKILEEKIMSEELRKYDLSRERDRSIEMYLEIIMNLKGLFQKHPKRRYCLLELMTIYNKTSEAFQLFNSIYGSQMLIMTASFLLFTLVVICRAFSRGLTGHYSWATDVMWFISLNFRLLLLAGHCEIVRREQARTEYFLNILMLHDEKDSIYMSQLATFLKLTVTHRRNHQVSARQLFNIDFSLLASLTVNTLSYAALLIQSYYMHIA